MRIFWLSRRGSVFQGRWRGHAWGGSQARRAQWCKISEGAEEDRTRRRYAQGLTSADSDQSKIAQETMLWIGADQQVAWRESKGMVRDERGRGFVYKECAFLCEGGGNYGRKYYLQRFYYFS